MGLILYWETFLISLWWKMMTDVFKYKTPEEQKSSYSCSLVPTCVFILKVYNNTQSVRRLDTRHGDLILTDYMLAFLCPFLKRSIFGKFFFTAFLSGLFIPTAHRGRRMKRKSTKAAALTGLETLLT